MALKYNTTLRNNRLDLFQTFGGAGCILKLRSGAAPANAAAADSGTVIATMNLPTTFMAAAAAGAVSKTGTWEDLLADNAGTVGHFRIYKSDGTTVVMQGTCSLPGAGGDMELINTNVAVNQPLTISSFTITDNNG